jgi:hypothetical protein
MSSNSTSSGSSSSSSPLIVVLEPEQTSVYCQQQCKHLNL